MTAARLFSERSAFWILAASLGAVQFKLSAAEVLFGVAALMWLRLALTDRRAIEAPAFFWPLLAYAALTILSAAFSVQPEPSLVDCKQLVLFLMVPMVMRLARNDRAMAALDVIIAVGAASALIGVVEALLLGFDSTSNRPRGTFSTQYMTYSGLIMLVLSATVARLLFHPAQRIWPGIALPALVLSLALTFTRNAWIGAVLAVVCLLAFRRLWLLVVVPLVAVPILSGLVMMSPALHERVNSIFDAQFDSNRDRLQMIGMGRRIVADHPLFGVGPDMIKRVYAQYRPPDAVHLLNPHLHNVPVQIAAERGLPALVAWLWFIVSAAWGLARQVRRGPARALAGAGLGAIVAMLAAGLFEYNFGDSEFLLLFLALITLPYALARSVAVPATAADAALPSRGSRVAPVSA